MLGNQPASRAHLSQPIIVALLVTMGLPLVCHFAFSCLGFNPTDDGFTLAYSRRLLDGQLPHRDFIIIRPPLSPVLHMPIVWFGGEYTFWLSRLVYWLMCGCMAWIWVDIASRMSRRSLNPMETVYGGCLAFMLLANQTPVMAWHTQDGLFLASIGVWIRIAGQGR